MGRPLCLNHFLQCLDVTGRLNMGRPLRLDHFLQCLDVTGRLGEFIVDGGQSAAHLVHVSLTFLRLIHELPM